MSDITCERLLLEKTSGMIEQFSNNFGDLVRKKGWNCVADLVVLLGARALEEIVIRKGLEAGGFADGKAATLRRIGVNIVVAVLRNVRNDGSGRAVRNLHTEPIVELGFF